MRWHTRCVNGHVVLFVLINELTIITNKHTSSSCHQRCTRSSLARSDWGCCGMILAERSSPGLPSVAHSAAACSEALCTIWGTARYLKPGKHSHSVLSGFLSTAKRSCWHWEGCMSVQKLSLSRWLCWLDVFLYLPCSTHFLSSAGASSAWRHAGIADRRERVYCTDGSRRRTTARSSDHPSLSGHTSGCGFNTFNPLAKASVCSPLLWQRENLLLHSCNHRHVPYLVRVSRKNYK